ncbi:MAG: M56 family metallopeptidase [Ruminococcus sp.]|nr:M56 family metallopeptidase [Ruminococcus sp.]
MSLLQMSFTGAILIMVIVVVRAIAIHRLPKNTFSVLWLLAIARLLCPISVPSPLSIYSLVTGNISDKEISDTVVYENQQTIFPIATEEIYNNYVISDIPQELPTESSVSIWAVIWFIGMLFSVGLFSVSYLRCRREFRTALPVKNTFIEEWTGTHHLKRKIEIRQFSGILTPMTYGLFKPVILLPENMDLNDRQQLQYILYHEFVHIRHYDIVLKILATTAFCVHWFNPFVWVMYILLNRDTELSCDECVIKHFGREKRSVYAKMLISMEERKNLFAPFCNNFSKNAIEERIESIMRIKKISVLSLALACTVVVGTAGVFATSVQADKEDESTQTVENTMTYDTETDIEHAQLFNPSDWWTYEEYAEWLENEKKELKSIIGEKSWTPSRGDFVWTEEIVEETIQMYEGILEEIRNGAMYSKFDDEDMIVITDNDSESTIVERDAVAKYYDTSEEQISEEDIFRIYEPFGMTYDADNDTLTFNGKTVRWFEDCYQIDGGNMAGINKFNENGVVDVYAVRDFTDLERNSDGSFDPSGKLIGLREFSQEEFNSRDINAIKNLEQVTIAGYTDETTQDIIQDIVQQTEETQILLKDYIPFGLNYEINSATGELSMNWQGKPVHSIFDEEKSAWIANSQRGLYLGSDAVDLEAVYENGTLIGLRDTQNHSSHNSVYVVQEAIAGDPVSDKETDSWLAEYGQFGVTYDKINNQWYFNGEKVRQFRDILTSNGEDLTSGKFHGSIRTLSGNGTVDIYTVRDFSNLNSDGNGTLIDVKAYNQEEFNEHTESNGILTESP